MKNRVIVRTTSQLSFAGEKVPNNIMLEEKGIFLKTSPNSNIKLWVPVEEIESIIYPNGKLVNENIISEL